MHNKSKIFIIALPRTGTTSICAAMLTLGYKVAHTAYTKKCMELAEVIADTPIFCDYQSLDIKYPNSKFIYLDRDLSLWIPSIKQLLQRMHKNVTRKDGGFSPILKRCYQQTFAPLTLDNIAQDEFLAECYKKHQQSVQYYFKDRTDDLLTINISEEKSFSQLLQFLQVDESTKECEMGFEKINIGGKITYWNKIKHPLKIDSNVIA